jgi:hypothetical protein
MNFLSSKKCPLKNAKERQDYKTGAVCLCGEDNSEGRKVNEGD